MCKRTRIFSELALTQHLHIFNALDGLAGAHLSRELSVTINRKAFLQRKLEPVSACNAVPGPIVEILMTNDTLDTFIVSISGCRRFGQCQRRVEYVETFVFHGTHVEVIDSNYVVHIQIALQAKCLLVPLEGFLQAFQRVIQLVHVTMLRVNAQRHAAAAGSGELALDAAQVPRHKRKKVRWLRPRVLPHSKVPPSTKLT
mmetsp:Transcript_84278/g.161105  ORF Transcript_84278/g.161105 Transcript_84278/m.161105 type:complete len:200 (+) Transcript_84278:1606-2205(+)